MAMNRYDCPACSTRIPWHQRFRFGYTIFTPREAPCPHCGIRLKYAKAFRRLSWWIMVPVVLMAFYINLPTYGESANLEALEVIPVAFLLGWVIGILFYTTGVTAFNLAPPEDES